MPAPFFARPRRRLTARLFRLRTIGSGSWASGSIIRSRKSRRACSIPNVSPSTPLFSSDHFRDALAVRQRHLPGATSFRVVNAESDFLSGLIIDKYADVLVMQISSLGMDQRKAMIVEALQSVFHPRAIFERNEASFRKFEGMSEQRAAGRFPGWSGVD